MNSYNYADVARIARHAILDGQSAALAISAEYGISHSNARHLVSKARSKGFDIPYERPGGDKTVDVVERTTAEFLVTPEPWMAFAECRDMPTDMFFPGRGQDWSQAKAVCDECCAKRACLDYALRTEQKVGIWGATSEAQRRVLRRTYKRNLRLAEMGAA